LKRCPDVLTRDAAPSKGDSFHPFSLGPPVVGDRLPASTPGLWYLHFGRGRDPVVLLVAVFRIETPVIFEFDLFAF